MEGCGKWRGVVRFVASGVVWLGAWKVEECGVASEVKGCSVASGGVWCDK